MSARPSDKKLNFFMDEVGYEGEPIFENQSSMPLRSDFANEQEFLDAYHKYLYETITLKAQADKLWLKDQDEDSLLLNIGVGFTSILLALAIPIGVYFEIFFPMIFFIGGIAIISISPELWIVGLIMVIIGAIWLYYLFSEMSWWQIILAIVIFGGVTYVLHLLVGIDQVLEFASHLF